MKKATLTIALFSLIMVITSFTTPIDGSGSQDAGGNRKVDGYSYIDHSGSQDAGGNRKVDYIGNTTSKQIASVYIDHSGSQDAGGNRKVD